MSFTRKTCAHCKTFSLTHMSLQLNKNSAYSNSFSEANFIDSDFSPYILQMIQERNDSQRKNYLLNNDIQSVPSRYQ